MIKRVYIDTSVIGGQFDKEFSAGTIPFFDAVFKGQFIIILSDLLETELLRAPQQVQDFLVTIPATQIERVKLILDAANLAMNIFWQRLLGRLAVQIASISQWQPLLGSTYLSVGTLNI